VIRQDARLIVNRKRGPAFPSGFRSASCIIRKHNLVTNLPEIIEHAQERLHQVDLRISPRPGGPPLVPRVIVVPLKHDLAVLNDERKGFDNLFGLGVTFGKFSRRKRVEWEEGIEDTV
jgi:hypothetical protein